MDQGADAVDHAGEDPDVEGAQHQHHSGSDGRKKALQHVMHQPHALWRLQDLRGRPQKKMGEHDFSKIPNGHPAIENRMELLFSEGVVKGKITPNKFVEVACTNPAKIFGMFPQKGTIAVGSDADIVLINPVEKHVLSAAAHHMNVDYSGYEGWELTGKVKTVLLRGTVAVENNECNVSKGFGRFVKRSKVSNKI